MLDKNQVGIKFRKYEPGDEEGLTSLAKAVLGIHFLEDYWKWKYLENPLGENYSYVAISNNDIVGFVGGIPWRVIVSGKELVGGQYTDMMVHPEWRKRGIFFPLNRKTLDEAKAKTILHYGFSNPISFRIYRKRFRWEGFHPLKMQKVIDIKSFVWQNLRRRKDVNFSGLANLISKILSSKKDMPLGKNPAIMRIDQFDARSDELWQKVRMRFSIATIRDSKYLNWRYIRHPQLHYTVFGAEEDGKFSGFVVLRCENKEGIMRGLIVDILVNPDREMTASLLIRESLRFFRRQKVADITTWMFESNPVYRVLTRNGFSARYADKVVLLIKAYSADISDFYLTDAHKWYLTMGDCDVF